MLIDGQIATVIGKRQSERALGFAIRLKPRVAAYDVEYSGYFQSGLTIGPVRNGIPCRSSVAGDPLEGIQIRLLKRATRSRRGA